MNSLLMWGALSNVRPWEKYQLKLSTQKLSYRTRNRRYRFDIGFGRPSHSEAPATLCGGPTGQSLLFRLPQCGRALGHPQHVLFELRAFAIESLERRTKRYRSDYVAIGSKDRGRHACGIGQEFAATHGQSGFEDVIEFVAQRLLRHDRLRRAALEF